jgi:ABC-2 type transport system ATP-binding protein
LLKIRRMSIKVENVTKFYEKQLALNNVSFSLKKGEIVGFLGPNGAGKSTLMKILTGYIYSFDGEVMMDGLSIKKEVLSIQKNVGYLPESNPLYLDMFVLEYLFFIADTHKVDRSAVASVLSQVGLTPEAHKKIKQLSKGYKQRVGIAAALIHDPNILILDEPTTGLDPNQLVEVRELIKDLGKDKIVLLSTHIMQEVEAVCDRVLILRKGSIVADENLKQLKSRQDQVIEVEFDFQVEERFIKEIGGLSYVKSLGGMTWELTFCTKEDMRPKVFDFSIENGLKIVRLNTQNKDLESLFRELTL